MLKLKGNYINIKIYTAYFYRQKTGGHMSSVMVSISDSTTLKVRVSLCVLNLLLETVALTAAIDRCLLLPADTEIKGDILFLGYYESEFDWSNETAKVKPPQVGCICSPYFLEGVSFH